MKRVLITGAGGFVGQHLWRAIAARGDLPVLLIRDLQTGVQAHNEPSPPHTIVFGSFDQVERAIAEYEVGTVIHLAAQTQVSTAVWDPVGTLEANVRGTWQVLEACRRQKVARVVIASSDKSYSDAATPYIERTPLQPGGIYATSKACADFIAQAYAREYRMSVVVTRCGNIYGPGHLNWSTLIPGTIRSILRGERPRLRSNGSPKRDYLYVADAVNGYLKLIDSDATGAFNFGSGAATSALSVVQTILAVMESDLLPFIESRSDGPVEIQDQVLDSVRAHAALGWEPRHSLPIGLGKAIVWYRDHLKERL